MRRLLAGTVVTAAAAGLSAAPAQATFHLTMVNEVMLASASGDTGTQFVEFLDNGGTEEAFTPAFAPYKLVVYDGAGTELGSQILDANGLRAAAQADTEYLVSTPAVDAQFGVTGNERLSVKLPTAAGQVCFAGSESPPQAVSCMTYGTITKPVPTNSFGTGTVHGPVPPNGESDQRQPDGSVIAAAPTPKARNRTASPPPGAAGKPALSHVSLTGVARRKATLRFTATAGSSAPALTQIVLGLPHGLSFDASKLATGVTLTGSGGFTAHVRGGSLVIKLARAAAHVSVVLHGGLIMVAEALARGVSQHRVKHLQLTVSVTDANGAVTKLKASASPS